MNKEKIIEKIQQLEKDKMGYLECDDKAGARRKEKQIEKLEIQLKSAEIEENLKIYKKFIKERKLEKEFQSFFILECARS